MAEKMVAPKVLNVAGLLAARKVGLMAVLLVVLMVV